MKTDRQIQQLVIDALNGQPYLNSTEILVSVKNGVVKLTGLVESECARVAIQNVITNGVKAKCIINDVHLNSTQSNKIRTKKTKAAVKLPNIDRPEAARHRENNN